METSINVILLVETLKKYEYLNVSVYSTSVIYKNKQYLITNHMGLPIKGVRINDIIVLNFIKCGWCDLLIIPFESHIFTFNKFFKKRMTPNDVFYINEKKVQYHGIDFASINLIPDNPEIMYYIMKINDTLDNISTGQPVYNSSNKLAGFVANIDDDKYINCIPINYLFKAFDRMDNDNIYTIKEDFDSISKIYNCKVVNNKIYCSLHKQLIPLDCYFAVNGDRNRTFSINNTNQVNSIIFNNNLINLDNFNSLFINNNFILLNSCFLQWLKINNQEETVDRLFNSYFEDCTINLDSNDYKISSKYE
jgi:hypothetical protein